jgi:hypothetical protein
MTLRDPRAVFEYRCDNWGRSVYLHGIHDLDGTRVKDHHAEWNVTLETNMMDRLIDWKLRSPAMRKRMKTAATAEGEDLMIRQFTIELRVNYADAEKNETMRTACAAAARHMFATANLLADGQKPEIAIFSDDWFAGKEEISLLEDVIQKGLDETSDTVSEGEVSSELMAAVRDSTS